MDKVLSRPRAVEAVDAAKMIARVRDFGFRPANPDETVAGIAISEALIGARLAPLAVISRIHSYTGISNWVTGDPVNGFFIFMPLSARGVLAIRTGTFVPAETREDELAQRGEPCFGAYIGVCAGATQEARRNVMTVSAVLRFELFAAVPCFSRAATEDGAKAMLRLGFTRIEGGLKDLFVQEALVEQQADAA